MVAETTNVRSRVLYLHVRPSLHDRFELHNQLIMLKFLVYLHVTEWPAVGYEYMDGMNFTTYDRDQDDYAPYNCAWRHHGAWWYRSCLVANPNGLYLTPGNIGDVSSMTYNAFRGGGFESLRTIKLMFR